jgi:hypothetical protein
MQWMLDLWYKPAEIHQTAPGFPRNRMSHIGVKKQENRLSSSLH